VLGCRWESGGTGDGAELICSERRRVIAKCERCGLAQIFEDVNVPPMLCPFGRN